MSSQDEEPKPMAQENEHRKPVMASAVLSHSLSINDPANPQNWPLHRRVFTSFQAWSFAATVALGISCFTAGKNPFVADFGLSMLPEKFVAGLSLYIFGIFFAPIWTPHVAERTGRTVIYYVALTGCALFNLGAGLSDTIAGVLVCRFFAGFFGGPCLVLLEGTFADIWSADTTNTYYAVQGTAAFVGVGLGPVVGGYLVKATGGWRWTQYFPVCLAMAVLLLGINMSETYQREIPRRQARYHGKTRAEVVAAQTPAQSGVTIAEIAKVTVFQPFIMFLTEPITMLTTIMMFFDFAVTFQWLIAVPAALEPPPPMGPGFSVDQVGLAFFVVVVGSILAALSVILIETVTNSLNKKKMKNDPMAMFSSVEHRLIPAMIGIVFVTVSLFWIANTVNPNYKPVVPIVGNGIFIWGSAMITFSIIPYLFDTFEPAGTLGAITSQAVARLLGAGFLPLLILLDLTHVGPKWGLGLFGFISLAMWPIPVVLFVFGAKWRQNSKYSMI